MSRGRGVVYLVGAGPGDPGLITIRGLDALRSADVVLFDRLVSGDLPGRAKAGALLIDVGKAPGGRGPSQNEINGLIVAHGSAGRVVVRLKGGDPFVFGRGYEELAACREAGVPCIVIPGVSSAIAGPAAAGIPVTNRGEARSFAVVTARTAQGKTPVESDYTALAGVDTVVVMMGRESIGQVAAAMIAAGRDPQTPAACIERATTTQQRHVVATLATLEDAVAREELHAPLVTVIGPVAGHAAVETASAALPLAGRRVLITRPRGTSSELRRLLSNAGAMPVELPLIRIDYPKQNDRLDQALEQLEGYNWLVFTSQHGVRGFIKRLNACGHDARALAGLQVAAVGPATADALRRNGLIADAVPEPHRGDALAGLLIQQLSGHRSRILYPCSSRADGRLTDGLRQAGADVVAIPAYQTVDVTPPVAMRRVIGDGVDVILFFSPSAVRSFVRLGCAQGDAVVGCVGPVTAEAAQRAGIDVAVVSEDHTSAGLVAALEDHFSPVGAGR